MNNSQEISNELKELSPFLAGLEKVNVFRVPDGYFDNLSERLFNFTILNTRAEVDGNKTNIQQVPEGYFDSLSTNILTKIKQLYPETADDELRILSPMLYSLKNESVFKVPGGYFDSLSEDVLAKSKELHKQTADEELRNLSSLLYSLRNENVFKVHDGYFDSLSENILAKSKGLHVETADAELRHLSPILYSLRSENVFTTPGGYFENFAIDIIKRTKPAKAKIVTMKPRSPWLKIAAAAVVSGIIAIGSLQIFNNSSKPDIPKTFTIASTEIPDYIKESFQFKTEEQLDEGIAKLSDDDIIKYLEKNGNIMDNDILLNNTDVTGLPSQDDYLIDENTLNSYLDKIDQKERSN
ncbi:MAG: hypothetical protein ABI419_04820 [Ginsengibacter sp.]